jgi:hypothetical protein
MEPASFQPRDREEDEFDLDIRVVVVEETDLASGDRPAFTGGFITCNCTHHPPYTCTDACN